jgi:hypothetical protein
MEVREATEADVPAIVSLLKLSLGETLMPKSEKYWRWKHFENPFGKSPTLLCWEGDMLIGVRAFMRWQWREGKRIYSALRAVDTATHTGYQGKGIFKKLTLALVDACTKHNDHFVFNTPNKQSKPGYVKMGWEEAGRLPINVAIVRPMKIARNLFTRPDSVTVEENSLRYYLDHPSLDSLIEHERGKTINITTNISVSYLKWRYMNVPVADYVAIGEEEAGRLVGLIIGRIKDSRLGNELRVTDFFFQGDHVRDRLIKKIKLNAKLWGVDYCTMTGTYAGNGNLLRYPIALNVPVGPIVTIRSLALNDLDDLKNFKKWSPTLGDLELF